VRVLQLFMALRRAVVVLGAPKLPPPRRAPTVEPTPNTLSVLSIVCRMI